MRSVVLINLFEVPPDADDRFIAEWERARDFVRFREGFAATALHRSLAPDAVFRFANIAQFESVDAWRHLVADPAFPARAMPFPAHPGVYEVLHTDGDGYTAGAVVINAFDVPVDDEQAAFTVPWHETHAQLATRPGYLGACLHHCLGTADFRFVGVSWWESAEECPEPSFYEVIRR